MTIQIIENFLPEDEFAEIHSTIVHDENFPWKYNSIIARQDEPEHKYCAFVHPFVLKHQWRSDFAHLVFPILRHLQAKAGIDVSYENVRRIKCNLYPASEVLVEHALHQDSKESHTAAILYLNDNDGYTLIGDQKVESVRNRLVVFDGSTMHCSTNCTDTKARFNINMNFAKPKNISLV